MAIIYLSQNFVKDEDTSSIIIKIKQALIALGHKVISSEVDMRELGYTFINKKVTDADILIFPISDASLSFIPYKTEVITFKDFVNTVFNKKFIYLYFPGFNNNTSSEFNDVSNGSVRITANNFNAIEKAIEHLTFIINSFLNEEEAKKYENIMLVSERSLKSSDDFVGSTKTELRKRERYLRNIAIACYAVAFAIIILGNG